MVQHVVEFMDGMPSLPVLFLLGAVASPALVVIHELGHALAALWRTTGPVFVRIGAKERRWAIRAGRFAMEAGPSELALAGGFCAYDPTGVSPLSRATIAMAGPIASLAGAAVAAVMWSHTGGPVHDFLSVATLGGLFAGVINALPLTFEGKENGVNHVARLDGLHALDALREQRRAWAASRHPAHPGVGPQRRNSYDARSPR